MIKEIALDPCLFAQWQHFRALSNSFGVEKGRVIALFSKKWRGLVRDEVRRLEAVGSIGSVKAKSIMDWLEPRLGTPELRMVPSKAVYDKSKSWHLNAEDAHMSFDAVLSSKEIESSNAIFADDEQEYFNHPGFDAETQRTVQRRCGPMVDCVWPLLRHSNLVKLVEPHFNPNKARFRKVLEALMDRLHSKGSAVREIELHVRHPDDNEDKRRGNSDASSFTISDLKKHLPPLMPSGWCLKVHLWHRGRERMHPRYLLTDRGGIQIDHGWDEGERETETTPINLLSQKRWEEEMLRYSLGSKDFEIDAAKDVILIR